MIHDSFGLLSMIGVRKQGQEREEKADQQLLTLTLLLNEMEHDELPDGRLATD